MPTPRKHAALIKQWADGAIIESRVSGGQWITANEPWWTPAIEYRVKPPPPAYRLYLSVGVGTGAVRVNAVNRSMCPNQVEDTEISFDFIKWISDWIEYDPA